MILVTGATGQTSRRVVRGLLDAGADVRALTRDAGRAREALGAGVDIVAGEWSDPGVLDRAVAGADRIWLAVGTLPDQDAMEIRVVDAAARAGHPAIVKLSTIGADRPLEDLADYQVGRWHHAVEQHLLASGLPHTVLRPNAYMQNLLAAAGGISAQSSLFSSTGAGRVSMVDNRDVADIAVAVLTGAAPTQSAITITGPEAVDSDDTAAAFTRALGRPVTHVPLGDADVAAGLAGMGLPPWLVDVYLEGNSYIRADTFSAVLPDVHLELTGIPRRTLEQFVHDHSAAFAAAA